MPVFKLPLMKHFAIACLVTVTFFGLLLGYLLTRFIENNHLNRATVLSSAFIEEQVKKHFVSDDFAEALDPAGLFEFEQKLAAIAFGPGVSKVKVWTPERRVLWSDDEQAVGQRYENNQSLNKAFGGETGTAVGNKYDKEDHHEEGEQALLELYVPVTFDGSAGVNAVFEVYTDLSSFEDDLTRQKTILWSANAAGVLLLFLALSGVVAKGAKTIVQQSGQIQLSDAKYLNLLRFAHDGIVVIDRNGGIILFNRSSEKIFGISADEAREEGMSWLFSRESTTDLKLIINKLLKGAGNDAGLSVKAEFSHADHNTFTTDISVSATGVKEDRIVTLIIKDPADHPERAS